MFLPLDIWKQAQVRFFKIILFYYLFILAVGSCLLCGFPLVVGGRGYSLVVVHELLIAVASCGAQTLSHLGFRVCTGGLSSLGSLDSRAQTHSCGAGP